jgi:LysR family transcriptional regulator, glycine cleavage system transcriptional activator
MRDLPLVALRALAAVYAQGGVRAAARELNIAHSSVSRHLSELETWMNVKLCEVAAGPRAFALTPQGHALGKAALTAIRLLERATNASREAKSRRSVTLSTTPSVAAGWLLPRLGDFESRQGKIELSVVVEQKPEDLTTNDIDLAIRMGRGPWKELDCEPLMDDALYPVMSPAYFAASKRPGKTTQLKGLRLLHDRDPNAGWSVWREAHGPTELNVRAGPRFTSSELVIRAAVLSQGVALARDRLVRDDVKSGALIRPFGDLRVSLPDAYWIVMPSRSRNRASVRALVSWLREQAMVAAFHR